MGEGVELTWSTFVLEIINFLVLVWILSHFLYKPVMDAIARRKASIEKALSDSEAIKRSAQALQEQLDRRLSDWESEKEKARAQLHEEFQAARARQLDALRALLEQEREKARVVDERRLDQLRGHLEETVLHHATGFLTHLLVRLASPELERRLVDLALEDLGALPEERREALRAALAEVDSPVNVTTGYPVQPSQRDSLTKALQQLAGRPVLCQWREDRAVLAGVRVAIGPWVLGANLQDELKYFAEVGHDRA